MWFIGAFSQKSTRGKGLGVGQCVEQSQLHRRGFTMVVDEIWNNSFRISRHLMWVREFHLNLICFFPELACHITILYYFNKTVSLVNFLHPSFNSNDYFDTSMKGWGSIWYNWKVENHFDTEVISWGSNWYLNLKRMCTLEMRIKIATALTAISASLSLPPHLCFQLGSFVIIPF